MKIINHAKLSINIITFCQLTNSLCLDILYTTYWQQKYIFSTN